MWGVGNGIQIAWESGWLWEGSWVWWMPEKTCSVVYTSGSGAKPPAYTKSYQTRLLDVVCKKTWPVWQHGYLSGGVGIGHSWHCILHHSASNGGQAVQKPQFEEASGIVIGGGGGYLLASRLALDVFLGYRLPFSFLPESKQYIRDASLQLKVTLNWRFN
jgi:hypothetical protein